MREAIKVNHMKMYVKDFDKWNIRKKFIHFNESKPPLFKERDIWWVSIGVNIGFEEDGKNQNYVRPVLVIKKFNRDFFLGVPMSTKLKNNIYYIPVSLRGKTVSVLTSQLRVFSSKRICNKLSELDSNDYNKVILNVKKMLFLSPLQKKRSRG